jgi:hypothetical protein
MEASSRIPGSKSSLNNCVTKLLVRIPGCEEAR